MRRLAYLNNALFFGLLELSLADGFFSRFGDLPSCQLLLQLDISSKCGVFVQILVILRLEESSAHLILRSDRWLPGLREFRLAFIAVIESTLVYCCPILL